MIINNKKLRNTNQRLKILEYLKCVKTHPTAEQVYNDLRKDMPAISLATVYRNLHLLAEQKEVLRLEINNEYHFDGDSCRHQHCVCKKCGKIIDREGIALGECAGHPLIKKDKLTIKETVLWLIQGLLR